MKRANGFVFMETIVVISILSITLLMLFTSYSYILRKGRLKNYYDTTENIYKTFYIKEALEKYKQANSPSYSGTSVQAYAAKNPRDCTRQTYGSDYSYICKLTNSYFNQIKSVFEVDKIYYLNPKKIIEHPNAEAWFNQFDATTIDYIRNLGIGYDKYILIVKYKKTYSGGDSEVYHSSIEVTS